MSLVDNLFSALSSAIQQGVYAPGAQLPSIRETAEKWSCNKITVKKAYDRLKEKGFIENSVGRGSFVKFPRHFGSGGTPFSFQVSSLSEEFLPLEKVRLAADTLFRQEGASLFAAPPPGGDPRCIEAFSRFYRTDPRKSVIISGAQQGLDLAGRILSRPVSEAGVFECPTYSGAINLFKPKRFVALKGQGPDLERLEAHAKEGIEAFYCMPQVHNPTGISYSLQAMEEVAALAEKYRFYIIEDDYLSEFLPDYFTRPPVRFLDLAPERTIYIKSFSKVTAPGIRLGLLAAPAAIREELLFRKFTTDMATGTLMQHLSRLLIEEGIVEESLHSLRLICDDRREQIEAVLERFPFLSFEKGRPGYNIWVKSHVDPQFVGAPWAKGDNFSFDPLHRNCFRLSFMSSGNESFKGGLDYLSEVFEGMARIEPQGIF